MGASCSSCSPFHPPIAMKHNGFYHLLVFLSLLSSLFLMFSLSTIYHFYGLWFNLQIRLENHRPFYDLCAIAGSYTPVVLTLMNNWFGYRLLPFSGERPSLASSIKSLLKKGQWEIQPCPLPDHGLVGSGHHSCHYQSNNTNFLESHGNWRTLLYSWAGFYAKKNLISTWFGISLSWRAFTLQYIAIVYYM